LREVEKWVGHIGKQLDGIIAKRADAPYRLGDDHLTVRIKNYRSADCVVGGFRDHVIGSARNELLLGLYDQKGKLQYVSSVGIDSKEKQQIGVLRPKKTTTSTVSNREKSHTGAEKPSGPGNPWLRPKQSRFAMIISATAAFVTGEDINAFIEAGLATPGTNRKLSLAQEISLMCQLKKLGTVCRDPWNLASLRLRAGMLDGVGAIEQAADNTSLAIFAPDQTKTDFFLA
jgi:hypothetical protein